MHVLELRVANFMRLVAIDVAPTGSVVEVAGKNGAGKSSTLDSMLVALAGGDHIPSKPIRKGEKAASIRVKLGDDKPTLIVTRTFAAKEDGGYTTQLVVEAADGARYAKPQTLLDDLLGALTFDPLAFTRMKPREQLQQLRGFVPGVDFEAIELANRGDFERRTDVNRQAKSAKARLDSLAVPGDPRQQRVDEAALVAELEQAGQKLAAIEKERASRQDAMRDLRALASQAEASRADEIHWDRTISDLEEQLAEAKERRTAVSLRTVGLVGQAKTMQEDIEALPPLDLPPDTTALRARIDAARKTNGAVDERERVIADRERIAAEISQTVERAATYTTRIDERNKQAVDAVAAAKLPVEGLGFADDEVLMNGLPFAQSSHAEKIRVSCAIAAAMSPKLKVMFVHDGSLLDEDSMELLRAFAETNGMQVWLEKVSSDSPTGILIEDGRVKAAEVAA
ncbi:MAG TPA: AAA family ATPase [Gammaproteobacteria bacterium]